MSVSKVQFDGNDLINLENDTALESDVAQGKTFHKADGSQASGTAVFGCEAVIEPLTITENGIYTATSEVDGYSPITVNVPGGESPWEYITTGNSIFANQTLPNFFTVDFPAKVSSIGGNYSGAFQYSKVTNRSQPSKLTLRARGEITSMAYLFNNTGYSGYKEIELQFSTKNVSNFSYTFASEYKCEKITGEIDFSHATSVSSMFYKQGINTPLHTVTFAPNTLSLSLSIPNCPELSHTSLVSIANGLSESSAGKTLTLHATPKAACATIMGNVAMDESNTYHIFTADVSGTITLENFITQTKGWTIA